MIDQYTSTRNGWPLHLITVDSLHDQTDSEHCVTNLTEDELYTYSSWLVSEMIEFENENGKRKEVFMNHYALAYENVVSELDFRNNKSPHYSD